MAECKLCYVENGIMYFTDNMEEVHGDDWNDIPYEHNAEEPNEECINKMIAFRGDCFAKEPCERGNFSVDEINSGAIAWLYHEDGGGLYGGDDISKCIDWLQKVGYKWGELHE